MSGVSVAALVITISFFVAFTMIYSASLDEQHNVDKAREIREKIEEGYFSSRIQITNVSFDGNYANITVENVGENVLNPYYFSVLINGTLVIPEKVRIGNIESTILLPGENATLEVPYSGLQGRVMIVTQYGNTAYYTG